MLEKLKANWKNILIVILVIFGMNKCTQSCNRGQQLSKAEETVIYQDSVIKSLIRDTTELNNKIKMLNGFNDKMNENIKEQNEIAKNQAQKSQELINKINILNKKKNK